MKEHQQSHLDLTSEPELDLPVNEKTKADRSRRATTGGHRPVESRQNHRQNSPVRQPLAEASSAQTQQRRMVNILFSCCHVYFKQPVPPAVLAAQVPVWRVHCPRCGKLVKIPVG